MKGYPKHIATVKDYENLLAIPEHRERALKDLSIIQASDTTPVKRSIATEKEVSSGAADKTEDIPNPAPLYEVKGFASREDVEELIRKNGGEVLDGK